MITLRVTARDGLNLRNGPGTHHPRIRALAFGEHVTAIRREGLWWLVRDVRGVTGWAHSGWLVEVKAGAASGRALVGLHAWADYELYAARDPGNYEPFREARIELAHVLTKSADGLAVQALRGMGVQVVTARIAEDVRRPYPAAEFVNNLAGDVQRVYDAGVRMFELNTEPNLPQDGLGTAWRTPEEWSTWFVQVARGLRARFPGIQVGYPGLSPGGHNPADWWARSAGARADAQWHGHHVYWQGQVYPGWAAQVTRDFAAAVYPKPVVQTEFSNSDRAVGPGVRAQHYVEHYRALRGQAPANFIGACSFVSSGFPQNPVEVWRGTEIPRIVGQRSF